MVCLESLVLHVHYDLLFCIMECILVILCYAHMRIVCAVYMVLLHGCCYTKNAFNTPIYCHSLSLFHICDIDVCAFCGAESSGGGTWPCVRYYLHYVYPLAYVVIVCFIHIYLQDMLRA